MWLDRQGLLEAGLDLQVDQFALPLRRGKEVWLLSRAAGDNHSQNHHGEVGLVGHQFGKR